MICKFFEDMNKFAEDRGLKFEFSFIVTLDVYILRFTNKQGKEWTHSIPWEYTVLMLSSEITNKIPKELYEQEIITNG